MNSILIYPYDARPSAHGLCPMACRFPRFDALRYILIPLVRVSRRKDDEAKLAKYIEYQKYTPGVRTVIGLQTRPGKELAKIWWYSYEAEHETDVRCTRVLVPSGLVRQRPPVLRRNRLSSTPVWGPVSRGVDNRHRLFLFSPSLAQVQLRTPAGGACPPPPWLALLGIVGDSVRGGTAACWSSSSSSWPADNTLSEAFYQDISSRISDRTVGSLRSFALPCHCPCHSGLLPLPRGTRYSD